MNVFKSIIALAMLMFFMSCNSQKNIGDTSAHNKKKQSFNSSDLIAQGYKEAVFSEIEGADINCKEIIRIVESGELLDPINSGEFFKGNYSKEEDVWVKFVSLRMKNRCDNARPIKIVDIKKRDD